MNRSKQSKGIGTGNGKNRVSFGVKRYSRSLELLDNYRFDTDFLLLDIQVSDMLGIDTAKEIRWIDENVIQKAYYIVWHTNKI